MEPEKIFMEKAIGEAKEAAKTGGYPIGAVIVKDGKIISTGRSMAFTNHDPTWHAEVDAIRNACSKLGNMYLEGCVLYTTHEPCAMCSSAAVWAKLKGIIYGASIEDMMEFSKTIKNKDVSMSWRQITIKCRKILESSEPKLGLAEGFLREECKELFKLSA
jgi:tRNA(Arg) A34 adenosine deaminase TadA